MDFEAFWGLIADSLDHASGRIARQEYLTDRLAKLPPAEIVGFQALLDQACDRAYCWDLWGAAARICGGCSDDAFEDFRLWLIGRGRAVFEQAVAAPDSLAAVPAITTLAGRHQREWSDREWPEWETLDYAAAAAYSQVAGVGDECRQQFHDAVEALLSAVTFRRDPAGERWDAGDEAAAARRIPGLAELFPLAGSHVGGA
jgi:hypothetical protein